MQFALKNKLFSVIVALGALDPVLAHDLEFPLATGDSFKVALPAQVGRTSAELAESVASVMPAKTMCTAAEGNVSYISLGATSPSKINDTYTVSQIDEVDNTVLLGISALLGAVVAG